MKRLFPHPALAVFLLLVWLILTRFSVGQLILGSIVACVAAGALKSLEPQRTRILSWRPIPKLLAVFIGDMLWSNYAVACVILRRKPPRSAVIEVPLQTRNRASLAILAIFITATPGTAWLGWNPRNGVLLVHVLDLEEEEMWRELMQNRYERTLMEIFG
ncbi:Na+/H+ antiporter subunit E [Falsirhodobacter sp. alg1]|uniref:Na+/H+ antiporter subunit E n=1 Tax=Falsirhodobacter sp. alg1 TaxID=1472418 RepID=UPI0005F01DF2|nr:Na+/H+ antiporter subunit E [Falsirhodobacter sp. alg1]